MTSLTDQHYAAVLMLVTSWKKQEKVTYIDLSVASSLGGLQMSLDVTMEKSGKIDIQKSNNALLDSG